MNDTPPEIAELVRAQLMAHSGAERFRMGVEMFEAARRMVLASLPTHLSEAERKRRLFERLYGMPLRGTVGRFTGKQSGGFGFGGDALARITERRTDKTSSSG